VGADAGALHDFVAVDAEVVGEVFLVPGVEEGQVEADVKGGEAVVVEEYFAGGADVFYEVCHGLLVFEVVGFHYFADVAEAVVYALAYFAAGYCFIAPEGAQGVGRDTEHAAGFVGAQELGRVAGDEELAV
jgi:hypothetical protein